MAGNNSNGEAAEEYHGSEDSGGGALTKVMNPIREIIGDNSDVVDDSSINYTFQQKKDIKNAHM